MYCSNYTLSKVPARKSVKKLVEVIEEDTKEFVAGDTIRERTTIGKGILEERSIDDPSIDREMGSRTNEITPSCCKSEKRLCKLIRKKKEILLHLSIVNSILLFSSRKARKV